MSLKKTENKSREYSESIINTVREPLIVLDQDLRVVSASRSFYSVFKVKPEETVGQLIYDLGDKQWDIPKLRELLENILPQKTTFDNYEVEHDFATIGRRTMLLNARQIQGVLGKGLIILLAIEDVTLMSNYQKELEAAVTRRTEELRRAFEQIKAASLDTIYRLSMASEYKDVNTGAHIKRMSRYCAAVARRMGLDENTIETILYAAPMHDLGKIGIPDVILVKPARLDPAEWEIMKLHTVIGARILKGSDAEFIRLGETIAQYHHEKWDGSGYPSGLRGTEIPVAGRIAAIADVFDALTSKRPYKEPFSVEKSLAIISEGRGSHFDPDVADAFFAIQDEILTIKQQYADDDQQTFDISELKTLLKQYNPEDVHKS